MIFRPQGLLGVRNHLLAATRRLKQWVSTTPVATTSAATATGEEQR